MSLALLRHKSKAIGSSLWAALGSVPFSIRRRSVPVSRTTTSTIVVRLFSSACLMAGSNDSTAELFRRLGIFRWLQNTAPCFSVDGRKVRVIERPEIFYATLLEKSRTAKQRITLASLYLGTGKLEEDIVRCMESTLESENKPTVRILLDATRGSRGEKNSRTMLLPLVKSFGDMCTVHLYHTPSLNGILKNILPQRWDEIVGLQHMKLYIFDHCVLVSGANLSNDYFTNRQDRYILIEDCPKLADFCDKLVETVCTFSFHLDASNNLQFDSQCLHPYEQDSQAFAADARKKILKLFEESVVHQDQFHYPNDQSHDTWIFPLVQMGQLGINMDNLCTRKILESIPSNAEMNLATGYFNLTQDYMDSILHTSKADAQILMAHPSANGFLGAAGFAGGIPPAYTLLASQFYQQVLNSRQDQRIRLWEYRRPGWTFHAKGLWMSFQNEPNDTRPCFTLIGSPNFGYRSVYRDLEAQLAIVTVNSSLRDQLDRERKQLFQTADQVNRSTFAAPDRAVPLWVRLVISVFRHFF